MSVAVPLPPALRELTRDGTLAAGLLAYALPSLAFYWLAERLDRPPRETAGIAFGAIMTVLVVPLWRWLAVRHGRFSAGGGCRAAVAAWIGTFGIAWLLSIAAAALYLNRLMPSATLGERVLHGMVDGLIIAGFTSVATFPAALALILLAVWCRWRRGAEFETRTSEG
ncbi:hypothetical protein ACI7BZ_15190 [Xanthobacter sp. AM11]|uniref:hypothetical protein n=1 Tax=Xanthobacter sp. AM11 TaxID=3380643 RepID=UPI0039BFCC5A